jgi:hypothetical protein
MIPDRSWCVVTLALALFAGFLSQLVLDLLEEAFIWKLRCHGLEQELWLTHRDLDEVYSGKKDVENG